MGIRINGVLVSKDKEVQKEECPHCSELVAIVNLYKHKKMCKWNPNNI